jgi:hypothetical protein
MWHTSQNAADIHLRAVYGGVGRLSDETLRLSQELALHTVLLTVSVHQAWRETWLSGYRQTPMIVGAHLNEQARTNRMIRSSVPATAAAQGLRVV